MVKKLINLQWLHLVLLCITIILSKKELLSSTTSGQKRHRVT